MDYVEDRVLAKTANQKEILESLLIIRDRIQLLSSAFGLEISTKQPIVLHNYKSLEAALRGFTKSKEHFKRLIHVDEVEVNSKFTKADQSMISVFR